METAQEFLERYLHEKSEFSRITRQSNTSLFQKFFGESFLKRLNDWQEEQGPRQESVESVDVSAASAKIITTQPFGKRQQRYCYHLASTAETWKITDQDLECTVCRAAGQINTGACPHCKGLGWIQTFTTR